MKFQKGLMKIERFRLGLVLFLNELITNIDLIAFATLFSVF